MTNSASEHQQKWAAQEGAAEDLVPVAGRLARTNGVDARVNGRSLARQSATGILGAHAEAGEGADVTETLALLQAVEGIEAGASVLDVVALQKAYKDSGSSDLEGFLREQLSEVAGQAGGEKKTQDVVLYGFGRIGRLLARILVGQDHGTGLQLRAVVVRKGKAANDLVKRADNFRVDSVHGPFDGTVEVDEAAETLHLNGTAVKVIYSNSPAEVDYTAHGITDAVVIDNTGVWRDAEGLSQHLQSKGVKRVVLTAPGKGDMVNVVTGVNDEMIGDAEIVSAASCTTNAITPVLKVLADEYGIVGGHVETIHSYTNDQNLMDNYHKADRRGRAAAMNMVLTETGAAKAVAKALPELKGKLSGNAIRVPTPDVSMAVLNLTLGKAVDRETLNKVLQDAAASGPLADAIGYVDHPEVVSTDLVGDTHAGTVDGRATIAGGDERVVVYVWYDNEYGYSCQVVRMVERMTGVELPAFPKA
ncbi:MULTISPECIES: glyceraldehyde-3-phosphate dehydrogenase [Kytococcus]|uniref:Glyceraldehyde-3-phosphate dehydrogenase n=1 Tax=Kytococcus schroeteri TaxID=138300 RepID=A0A2I1P9B2_9MICO|nr:MULTISPECIES: glyceraldehyde-3-phosphate dehydrogenase [Kytococcus]OFS16077.1 glyceraldehyde-3-phosphate dehydrogenase [Kytococcus sp. HMSC28H12]PKZ41225.1 glyceraldehyde-3-phosphate dehydrogenase [Kytococcus schroeteri]